MTSLKRHLVIILSILMVFTMCPTALYASSTAADGAATMETTEPEEDAAPDEFIVDETESITEESIDEAFDETAPVIEETVPETDESPDTEEYEDAKEPVSVTEVQEITPNTDEIAESEELVGAPVTVGENVTATFNSSTGAVVLTSKNGTLWSDWIQKSGFDKYNIKSIKVGSGTVYFPEYSAWMFYSCVNLKTLDLNNFGKSKITNARGMFSYCRSLESLSLGCLDTSNCGDMLDMFDNCSSLTNLYLGDFKTSNVTSMNSMFSNCESLKSLNLRDFNTAKVVDMECMFWNCKSLTNLNLSSFNTPNLQNINNMFCNCSSLASVDMSGFDLSKAGKYTLPLFEGCQKLKIIKTPKKNTVARTLPVTLYDQTGKSYTELPVISKSLLLARPKQLAQGTMIVGDGVTASMDSSGAVLLYSDNGTLWDVWTSVNPSLRDMTSCKAAYGIVYLPVDSSGVFAGLEKLKSLTLTNFNTSRVTNMSGMFSESYELEQIDLSMFNTSKVTNTSFMFYRCFQLKILDLSGFDLSNDVENPWTFYECGVNVIKTPKRDKMQTNLYGTFYDSSGKAYTSMPNLSKSIVLARSKQLAKDCETYGKLFTDVLDSSHPYYKAIYWAAQKGITKGYDDGSFGIDLPCTRGHAAMFLWRMAGCPAPKDVSNSPFSDVPKTHTFYKAILWAQQKGITYGYTTGPKKGKFGIDDTCTRGQIMTFIWRYKGKPKPKAVSKSPFSDVPMNHVFYQAILWAYQNGVTNGYTSGPKKGMFGIDDDCTRGQIVTFLYRIR